MFPLNMHSLNYIKFVSDEQMIDVDISTPLLVLSKFGSMPKVLIHYEKPKVTAPAACENQMNAFDLLMKVKRKKFLPNKK